MGITFAGAPIYRHTVKGTPLDQPRGVIKGAVYWAPMLMARALSLVKGKKEGPLLTVNVPKKYKEHIRALETGKLTIDEVEELKNLKGKQKLTEEEIDELQLLWSRKEKAQEGVWDWADLEWEGRQLTSFYKKMGWLLEKNPKLRIKNSNIFQSMDPASPRFMHIKKNAEFTDQMVDEINKWADYIRKMPKAQLVQHIKNASKMIEQAEAYNRKYGVNFMPLLEDLYPIAHFIELRNGLHVAKSYGNRLGMTKEVDFLGANIDKMESQIERNLDSFNKVAQKLRKEIAGKNDPVLLAK